MRPRRISFILPTCGRDTLRRVVSQLRTEIGGEDEVIVVGDGVQPVARGVMCLQDWRFKYFEHQGGDHGDPQRDFAIARASGDFLMFIDDDDLYVPGAIRDVVHPALDLAPDRAHMFRCCGGPDGRVLEIGGVMGPQFVPPNNPEKLVKWCRDPRQHYWSDFLFIKDTLGFYPEGPVFHNDEIYRVRPEVTANG